MQKAMGSYHTYSSLVKLQPWFLSLQWKTCLRQNCSLGSCACCVRTCPWAEHSDDDDENKKKVVIAFVFMTLIIISYNNGTYFPYTLCILQLVRARAATGVLSVLVPCSQYNGHERLYYKYSCTANTHVTLRTTFCYIL